MDKILPPQAPGRTGPLDFVIAAATGVTATLFHLVYINHGVFNWLDLGVAANDATRILDGEVFGRDFLAPYGPGRYYLTALWFRLFGESLFVLNTLFLCLMTAVDVMTYFLARRVASRPLALAAALLAAAAHGPVHKVYVTLISILFLWFLFDAAEKKNFLAGFFMGLFGALAGLFRYDIGAMAALCGLFVVVAASLPYFKGSAPDKGKRLAGGFLCGGLLVVAPALALLYASGGDLFWIIDHVLSRIKVFDVIQVNEQGIGELFSRDREGVVARGFLSLVFLTVPFVVTAWGAYDLFVRKKGASAVQVLVLGLMGLFLLNQWRLIPRFVRLLQVGPVLYIGMALLAFRIPLLFGEGARVAARVVYAVVIVLLCSMGFYLWEHMGDQSQDSIAVLRYRERFMEIDRAQCYVRNRRCREMTAVVDLVRQYVGDNEPIWAGPACPVVPFLADRRNPAPYSDPYLYFFNKEAEQKVIDAFENSGVRLCVDWPQSIIGLSLADGAPRVYEYMNDNFPIREQVGRFVIMRR